MNNEALKNFLNSAQLSRAFGQTALTVESTNWMTTMETLRAALSGNDSMLVCLSVVDREEEGFELFAHLRDVVDGGEVVVKTLLEKRETLPSIDSLCALWGAAELMEDEVFDLFGIRFTNHPNLRRIMLDDEFNGYPLRKNFKQDVHE